MTTRIVLADDHTEVRAALRRIAQHDPQMRVVAEARDGCRALDLVSHFGADVIMMDISMPVLNGIEATRQLVAEDPRCRVIAMSFHGDAGLIREAFEAGASGYMLKESAARDLVPAIRTVREGGIFLTPQLRPVLQELADNGMSGRGSRISAVLERLALRGCDAGHNSERICPSLEPESNPVRNAVESIA